MSSIVLKAALAAIVAVGIGIKMFAVSTPVTASGQPAAAIDPFDLNSRAPLTLPIVTADLS